MLQIIIPEVPTEVDRKEVRYFAIREEDGILVASVGVRQWRDAVAYLQARMEVPHA
jgi:hypothetical protein